MAISPANKFFLLISVQILLASLVSSQSSNAANAAASSAGPPPAPPADFCIPMPLSTFISCPAGEDRGFRVWDGALDGNMEWQNMANFVISKGTQGVSVTMPSTEDLAKHCQDHCLATPGCVAVSASPQHMGQECVVLFQSEYFRSEAVSTTSIQLCSVPGGAAIYTTRCTKCRAGTFKSSVGGGKCEQCPPGTWRQAHDNSTECTVAAFTLNGGMGNMGNAAGMPPAGGGSSIDLACMVYCTAVDKGCGGAGLKMTTMPPFLNSHCLNKCGMGNMGNMGGMPAAAGSYGASDCTMVGMMCQVPGSGMNGQCAHMGEGEALFCQANAAAGSNGGTSQPGASCTTVGMMCIVPGTGMNGQCAHMGEGEALFCQPTGGTDPP